MSGLKTYALHVPRNQRNNNMAHFLTAKEFSDLGEKTQDEDWIYPYSMLPKIDNEEITPICVLGSWDGPISGIIKWNEKHYLVDVLDPFPEKRRFLVIEVSEEDAEKAILAVKTFNNYELYMSDEKGLRKQVINEEGLSIDSREEKALLDITKIFDKSKPVIGYFEEWIF